MNPDWIPRDEHVAGSWHVYVGEPTPMSAKVTGKLWVTNRHIYFDAGLLLEKDAATGLSHGLRAFETLDRRLVIPLADVAQATILRRHLILKSLRIVRKSGSEVTLQFGAASPRKALDAILRGMKR